MAPEQGTAAQRRAGRWDPVVVELQSLRQRAGEPSYAEIARRVVEARVAAGSTEHAARVAKSTVHDAFRLGRTRLNLPLTRELAQALGGDPAEVDVWVTRAVDDVDTEERTDVGTDVEVAADAGVETGPVAVAPPAGAGSPGSPPRATPTRSAVALLLVASVLLNVAGGGFVDALSLPFFLDMVGTAVAAIALGPWHGVAVALASNALGAANVGWSALPFALVNATGALLWGYGVRRWGLGRTLPRYLGLNVLVAVACTLVAVPILVLVFGGTTGHDQEDLRDTLHAMTDLFVVSVGFSNLLVSLADKVMSGFVALVVVSALPLALLRGCDPVLAGSAARREE